MATVLEKDLKLPKSGSGEFADRSPYSSQAPTIHQDEKEDTVAELSSKRLWAILAVLVVSMFVDVVSGTGFTVYIAMISEDLNIVSEQQTWIISAYVVTFASTLLLWGRVSDFYAARSVFAYAFIAFGALNLITSFLVDQYTFFVFRAITGIAGSALVPSSYRLIASTFPVEQRGRAYTIYGMTGSIANVSGLVLAGVVAIIQAEGQMRAWRWFCRLLAIASIPSRVAALLLVPVQEKRVEVEGSKLKRFDLVGVLTMFAAVVSIILALTLGATYGWSSPAIIVPIIISAILFSFFFWWETRQPEGYALIPPALWRLPNMAVLIILGLVILGWWGTNFVPYIEMYITIHDESLLKASVRTLPEGIAAGCISVIMLVFPKIIARPRWPIAIGLTLAAAASILWTQASDIAGVGYWKYVMPGMVFGSLGMQVVLLATIVGVMLVAPPSQAGVVGAILQTSMHTSTVVSFSIQAGLLTIKPGGVHDFTNVRTTWYFELGWVVVWLIGFLVLYRPGKNRSEGVVGGAAHV